MKNKASLRALVLCAGLALGVAASAATAETPPTMDAGRLRVAVYNDFPPYSDNRITSYNVCYTKLLHLLNPRILPNSRPSLSTVCA